MPFLCQKCHDKTNCTSHTQNSFSPESYQAIYGKCQVCKSYLGPCIGCDAGKKSFPKKITTYLHSDKESNWSLADEMGLKGEAAENFSYALYEVKFILEVYEDGTYKILEVKE